MDVVDAATAVKTIRGMIQEEGVERVVIGLPVNMDGSVGPAARGVMAWAKELAAGVELIFEDERLSSFDAEQSLIARFARYVPATDEALQLDFGDREEETFVDAPNVDFASTHNTPYFARRGLTLETTRRFGAVEATFTPAIVLPWFDAKGRCVTIKHRSIADKRFWYDPPVSPGRLKRILYGFHLARQAKITVVCEGEIDAMSVAQAGFSAVALGGAHLSTSQATLLKNSVCDEVVVFTDNDEAGRKARAAIVDALVGHKRVSVVDWSLLNSLDPRNFDKWNKDANDLLRRGGEAMIRQALERRIPVGLSLKLDK
jgi:5S rRNA maturation endonuclease (ribonuclease M5)